MTSPIIELPVLAVVMLWAGTSTLLFCSRKLNDESDIIALFSFFGILIGIGNIMIGIAAIVGFFVELFA
jgi:hypothetical protein